MTQQSDLEQYVHDLVGNEDTVLAAIRERHGEAGLPTIQISAAEGQLIAVLLRTIQAQRVLEVGTLGGYSGVWIARSIGPNGKLVTIEANPEHAEVARIAFDEAGVGDRVQLLVGEALTVLPTLDPTFDAVFLDADKEPLPEYFDHAMRLLRVGGLLLCDNTFFHGRVLDAGDGETSVEGVRSYNRLASEDPRLESAIAPIRDGLMISLKVGD